MININATLLHDLLEIAVEARVAQIEEHGIQDRFLWEMYALEVNHRCAPLIRHLCRKITAASRDPAKVLKVCDRTSGKPGAVHINVEGGPLVCITDVADRSVMRFHDLARDIHAKAGAAGVAGI
jgi:hypothetical protein